MKILVCGCVHGSWDIVVDKVNELVDNGTNIDLILVAGDLEAFMTEQDLESYKRPQGTVGFGSFHKLFTGEKRLPCKMLVIGGNNEAGDSVFQLPFGGWFTPDIYFAGRASQIYYGDLKITSISGVYNKNNYRKTVFEKYPVREKKHKYSINHTRIFSVFQTYGLKDSKILITHDWPSGIPTKFRDIMPRQDLIESDEKKDFGFNHYNRVLNKLKPEKWFAAHHHMRFNCRLITETDFLAVPRVIDENWYEIVEFAEKPGDFMISGEWLTILKQTEKYMKDPSKLNELDWDEEWDKIRNDPQLQFTFPEKVPVVEYNKDLKSQTIQFCEQYGIYNPNIF